MLSQVAEDHLLALAEALANVRAAARLAEGLPTAGRLFPNSLFHAHKLIVFPAQSPKFVRTNVVPTTWFG